MSRLQLESKLYWNHVHEARGEYEHYWQWFEPHPMKLKKGVLHQEDLGGLFPLRGDKAWNKVYHIRPNRAKQTRAMNNVIQIYNYNPDNIHDWYDPKLPIFPHKPHSYYW